jgi:hypothetical protein
MRFNMRLAFICMCYFLCLPKESNQRKGPTNPDSYRDAATRARALSPHMPPAAHASLCARAFAALRQAGAPFVDALPRRGSSTIDSPISAVEYLSSKGPQFASGKKLTMNLRLAICSGPRQWHGQQLAWSRSHPCP